MRCFEADILRGKWYAAAGRLDFDDPLVHIQLEEIKRKPQYQKWLTELYCHMKSCALCRQIQQELTQAAMNAQHPEIDLTEDLTEEGDD